MISIRGHQGPMRIAAALGYQDPPSFTRAFRRWTGTTPSQAREALLRRD